MILRLFFTLLVLIFISCSSSSSKVKRPGPKDYKVSVESGGKVVENPASDLLKRVRIRSADIVRVFGTKTAPKIPALSVVRSYDGRSKVMGLEVASKTSVSDALGLNVGDIVTAIGSKMVRSPNDLKSFAVLFHDSNELGFSYERGGIVRKTILYRTE